MTSKNYDGDYNDRSLKIFFMAWQASGSYLSPSAWIWVSGHHAHASATYPQLKPPCGQNVWHLARTGKLLYPPIKKIIYRPALLAWRYLIS